MTGFLNARGGRIAYEQTGQGSWLRVPGWATQPWFVCSRWS